MGTTKKPPTIKTNPGDSVWDRVRKFMQAAILENARIYSRLLEQTGMTSVGGAFCRVVERLKAIPNDMKESGVDGISKIWCNTDGEFRFAYGGQDIEVGFRSDPGWRTGYVDVSPDDAKNDILKLREIERQLKDDKQLLVNRAFVVDRLIPAIDKLEKKAEYERSSIIDRLCRDDILPIGC